MAPKATQSPSWHISKDVPLALILAILFQTAIAIWWAAGINARVVALEEKMIAVMPQHERLVRLETRFENVLEKLTEIKTIVLRPPERPMLPVVTRR